MSINTSAVSRSGPARVRRTVRAGIIAAFGVAVSLFGTLPVAGATYDADWYDWCMNNLEEGSDYCCEHAGGVVRQGACINPDDLLQLEPAESGPTARPTVGRLPDFGQTFTQVEPDAPTTTTMRAPAVGVPPTVAIDPGN